MKNTLLQLFNEYVNNATATDNCAVGITVFDNNTVLEIDWFDRKLVFTVGNELIHVEYYTRPNMKEDYSCFDDWYIDLIDTAMFNDRMMFTVFKYRDVDYRFCFDCIEHTFIVQLVDQEDGDVIDFDDGYTDDFSVIINNVVNEYDSNVEYLNSVK